MMGRTGRYGALLSLIGFTIATDANICNWYLSRAGTVRNGLFIDGGTFYNGTWNGTGWDVSSTTEDPVGSTWEFNYGTSFEYSNSPPDLNTLLQQKPYTSGSSFDAPSYRSGAMFTDDYELYTYG